MLATMIIIAFAGTGEKGYAGDGGHATKAKLDNPFDVAFSPFGHLYFSDTNNHVVRIVNKTTGNLETIAGSGKKGFSGDGGLAVKAELNEPYGIELDAKSNLYIVDRLNFRIRKVDGQTGIITTIAGTGKSGTSMDGLPAVKADLMEPNGLCLDGQGMLYIADVKAHKVRSVNLATGEIGTLLGTGEKTSKDGPLHSATTMGPRAVAYHNGCIYLVEREGHCVRKIDLAKKTVTKIAGTGKKGYTGDGGQAIEATFDGPKELDLDKAGNIYVVDTENEAIRRIDAKTGVITTVAGKGRTKTPGQGDGGDPLKATLGRPHGVAVGPDGAIYIGDTLSHRIRVVKPKP